MWHLDFGVALFELMYRCWSRVYLSVNTIVLSDDIAQERTGRLYILIF